jgi:hypothetical protein
MRRFLERLVQWRRRVGRIRAAYRYCHGQTPDLLRPRRYSEKIQWRKLFDLDPRYAMLPDKIAVRDFIAGRVGNTPLVPLLWVGDDPEALPFERLLPPFVLKSSHATTHSIVVETDQDVDRDQMRHEASRGWTSVWALIPGP